MVELKSDLAQILRIHRGAKSIGILGVEQQKATGPGANQLPTKSAAIDTDLVPTVDRLIGHRG